MSIVINEKKKLSKRKKNKQTIESTSRLVRSRINQVLPPPLQVTHEEFNEANADTPGIVRVNEDGELLKEYIKFSGLTDYIIEGYDNWIENRLHLTVKREMVIDPRSAIVTFSNILRETDDMWPQEARDKNSTYSLGVYANVNLWVTEQKYRQLKINELQQKKSSMSLKDSTKKQIVMEIAKLQQDLLEYSKNMKHEETLDMYKRLDNERRRKIIEQIDVMEDNGKDPIPPFDGLRLWHTTVKKLIFKIPLMLGSSSCKLRPILKNKKKLIEAGEDPIDPFGYFIVNGVEKIVAGQEKLRQHRIFLYRGKEGVIAQVTIDTINRGTVITKLIISDKSDDDPDSETANKNKKVKVGGDQYIKIFISTQRPDQINLDETEAFSTSTEVDTVMKIKSGNKGQYKKGVQKVYVHFLHIYRVLGIEDVGLIERIILNFVQPQNRKAAKIQLIPSLSKLNVDSVDYLRDMFKIDKELSQEEAREVIIKIIKSDIIPHLVVNHDFEADDDRSPLASIDMDTSTKYKLYTVSIMAANILEYMIGNDVRTLDNRDVWGNKLLETAGPATENLVRAIWGDFLRKASRKLRRNKNFVIETDSVLTDYASFISEASGGVVVTDAIAKCFRSSIWGITSRSAKNNISQKLEVNNIIAKISHIRIIIVNRSRSSTLNSVRQVQPSQFGGICFVKSSEGANCGLLKELALTSRVSIGKRPEAIINKLRSNKYVKNYPDEEADSYNSIMVNGIFAGWCNSESTAKYLRGLRRKGIIAKDTGIVRTDDGFLHVHTDAGRVIVPYLILDEEGTESLVERDKEKLIREGNMNFTYFLTNGYVEYVDSWEQEYILIAASKTELRDRSNAIYNAEEGLRAAEEEYEMVSGRGGSEQLSEDIMSWINEKKIAVNLAKANLERAINRRKYTHMFIDPAAILSVSASTIPLINHNQGPRNTYETNMVKQAMAGMYHWNQSNRFDGTIKMLLYSNRPLFSTITEGFLGLDERPQGQNAIVAFWAHPDTQEDSFVVSKRFIDSGGFMYTKIVEYNTEVKFDNKKEEMLGKPEVNKNQLIRYKNINDQGLPHINAYLVSGDCVIGKIRKDKQTGEIVDVSTYLTLGEEGRVVDVDISVNVQKRLLVRVKMMVTRKPQVGDKLSNRTSQKGTIGKIVNAEDMPFTSDGMIPDIIVNPHAVSRMTAAYFIEMITGRYAALYGDRIDASAFRPFNLQYIEEMLTKAGYMRTGKQVMYDGVYGNILPEAVYIGPAYFHALKHNVRDKAQARGLRGPVSSTTRQAVSGRANLGGLRFGEMERDAALSHGVSNFIKERLCSLANGYQLLICRKCSVIAERENATKSFVCRLCKKTDDVMKVEVPFAFIYFQNLLAANGFIIKMHLEEKMSESEKGEGVETEADEIEIELSDEEEEEIEEDVDDDYDPTDIYNEDVNIDDIVNDGEYDEDNELEYSDEEGDDDGYGDYDE